MIGFDILVDFYFRGSGTIVINWSIEHLKKIHSFSKTFVPVVYPGVEANLDRVVREIPVPFEISA